MAVRTIVITLTVFLGACSVGAVDTGSNGVDGGGSGSGMPGEATFMTMIQPLVGTCTSCHSGVQAPNLTSFAALGATYKTKPGASNILTIKGAHQGAAYFTPAQQTTVAAWIDSL